jgi:hypothetical protein
MSCSPRSRTAAGLCSTSKSPLCTNLRQLHAELRDRGYKGGYGTIRDYVLPFRIAGAKPPAVPEPPNAGDLASWMLFAPDNLGASASASLRYGRALAGEFGEHGQRVADQVLRGACGSRVQHGHRR